VVVLLQRTCLGNAIVLRLALILYCDLFQNRLEHWQQLDCGFLDQAELQITYNTNFCQWLLLYQFFRVVSAHVLSVVYEEMRYYNSLVCVVRCLSVLMNLTIQCAHLHMRFAFVL
jgi:hypothetical protein